MCRKKIRITLENISILINNLLNRNSIKIISFILLISGSSLAFFPISSYIKGDSNVSSDQYYINQFQEVLDKVNKYYVQEPDKDKMVKSALNEMLLSLDPHSSYLTGEDLEELENRTKGEFGGIGIKIQYDNGLIKIISPIEGLPAEKAGIKAGDYITSVNGESVNNLGLHKSLREMRGKPGTKVKITIAREGQRELQEYEIVREIIKIKPVKYHLDDKIAYIRLIDFNNSTFQELQKSINKLGADNVQGIILDLRNNPGGILDQAVKVSEYFIDSGLIVRTQGRTEDSKSSYFARSYFPKAPKVPMVVLINSGSASASEIVAGALRHYKRAVIMGTRSFGKGSVQRLIKLKYGTAMAKLTTAFYYTPSGDSIQAKGIVPDIEVEQIKIEPSVKVEGSNKLYESSFKNHLKNNAIGKENKKSTTGKIGSDSNSSGKNNIDEKFLQDNQYIRAIDLLKSLVITKQQLCFDKNNELSDVHK